MVKAMHNGIKGVSGNSQKASHVDATDNIDVLNAPSGAQMPNMNGIQTSDPTIAIHPI